MLPLRCAVLGTGAGLLGHVLGPIRRVRAHRLLLMQPRLVLRDLAVRREGRAVWTVTPALVKSILIADDLRWKT